MTIPLFPLGTTLFPDGLLSLRIFEVRYLDMVKKCMANGTGFGVVTLHSGSEVRTPEGEEKLADFGTMARIDECKTPMPGLIHLRCTGTSRFSLTSSKVGKFGLWHGVTTDMPDDPPTPVPAAMQGTVNRLGQLLSQLQKDRIPVDEMPIGRPYRLDESGWVANRWAELLPLTVEQKQRLLAINDPVERLAWVNEYLNLLDPGS